MARAAAKARKAAPKPPTDYTEEVVLAIVERLTMGDSVASICKLPGMPAECTFYSWLHKHPEFQTAYDTAKQAGLVRLSEEIRTIADSAPATNEGIAKARLQVDSRKWLLSKLVPKVYGDKVAHTGEDGGPVRVVLSQGDAAL